MAKITKILYERINSNIFSEYDVGLNYFYQNAIGVNDNIDNEFISYEEKQKQDGKREITGHILQDGRITGTKMEQPHLRPLLRNR